MMTHREKFLQLEHFGFGPYVMQKVKVCPYCGEVAEKNESRCQSCGEKLPRITLFDIYRKHHSECAWCGTMLTDDSQYCPHCGRPVLKDSRTGKKETENIHLIKTG